MLDWERFTAISTQNIVHNELVARCQVLVDEVQPRFGAWIVARDRASRLERLWRAAGGRQEALSDPWVGLSEVRHPLQGDACAVSNLLIRGWVAVFVLQLGSNLAKILLVVGNLLGNGDCPLTFELMSLQTLQMGH